MTPSAKIITIQKACEAFLSNVEKSMPYNTFKNYKSDLMGSTGFISFSAIDPQSPVDHITEDAGIDFMQALLDYGASPATRLRRASSMFGFFRFSIDRYHLSVSVDKLIYRIDAQKLLSKTPTDSAYPAKNVRRVLDFTKTIMSPDLNTLRDLAFIWSLAETGARVSEAIAWKIGQMDNWNVVFIGKGNVKRTVHLGKVSRASITAYLNKRKALDESTGRYRDMLPLFCRHDSKVGKNKVKPISSKVGEKIVHNMVSLALGKNYDPEITCHTLRHYYITSVMRAKGMRAAQIGAGHKRISVTERYAHLDSDEIASINTDTFG